MRKYVFNFEQAVALRLGLNLKELLLLDYIYQFVNSGNMRSKKFGEKLYFRLTYKKVLDDLPMLHVKERQLRNMFIRLEKKNLLYRASELKNELHIYIDFDALFGNKLPDGFDLSEIGFQDVGNGLLTIDYYDIKKIKIIHDNARVKNMDKNELLGLFLENLKRYVSQIVFDCFIKDKVYIDEITNKYIIFSVTNIEMVGKKYGQSFHDAFIEIIKDV